MFWNRLLWAATAMAAVCGAAGADVDRGAAVETYAEVVYENYAEARDDAVALLEAVDALIANPNPESLAAARQAWLKSRESYGQTEVFRFYGGPIDGVGPEAGLPEGVEGPEGRINAWPLNEAFIDYVKGSASAGIINDDSIEIGVDALIARNAVTDEADVTTGYHAIEFLLWGQDHSAAGPGSRPVSDYAGDSAVVERRKTYLKTVTDLLVSDLAMLVEAWSPESEDNYRAVFLAQEPRAALGRIMTGMATLSGFELASERIAVALDSGDQEDEHSCFSDNTHRDFVTNIQGIRNAYIGSYGRVDGPGVRDVLAEADPELAAKLEDAIAHSLELAKAIEPPVDRILATDPGDPAREPLEALVDALYTQAELLMDAGEALGVQVEIAGE